MPGVFRTISYIGLSMSEWFLEDYHVWISSGDSSPIRVSKHRNSYIRQVVGEYVFWGGKDGKMYYSHSWLCWSLTFPSSKSWHSLWGL